MEEKDVGKLIQTSAEVHEASALPCARVVHTAPDAPRTAEMQPLPDSVAAQPIEEKSPAQWAYERLILYIRNFEEQLDDEHEVAMGFVGGDTGVLRIEGLGYFDPDIITFYGAGEDGVRMQLIQHVSQLSVMLRAMPKAPEVQEPRRIGFRLVSALERDKQADG
ncbi:hypothetical protein LV82_01122 [Albidovulum inexpectatum]|uniref:Uncharacterized protein n=1 Tax=Albidovulum inexpectatum TaxID=196587 RepID=A0A2S5JHZ2_9RHOB|nr:DUF6173 family protein [Albidovulum inexpectatum]PPB81083.1 hypothetical protein LV82_01122 [Albidovulum inexpectatum]